MQRDFGTVEQETMSLEQLAKAILSHMEPIHDDGRYAIFRLKTKYALFDIHAVYGQWEGCEDHEHDDTWPECKFGFCYTDKWLIGPVTIRKR